MFLTGLGCHSHAIILLTDAAINDPAAITQCASNQSMIPEHNFPD
jgi:hypothetical protein